MTVIQTMKKINKRIPGRIPPPKTEIDGKITDLSSKTIPELLELQERQQKLLNNKSFLSRLADKGAKVQALHDKIVAALKTKQDDEQTCKLFNNLRLGGVDKETVDQVEWEGKIKSNKDTYLDSDDDSDPEDIIQILCKNTAQEKNLRIIKAEKRLVTPDDIIEIGDIPHVRYLVNKTEEHHSPKTVGNFKPYHTTKSDVHHPEKESLRKKHKNWEITAATPPPIIHGPAKTLSLDESLKLQQGYNLHMKEIEAQHAAEKLLAHIGVKMDKLPGDVRKFGIYRDVFDDSEASDPEGSDKEVHDEEPEKGGVVFTVMK